MKKIIFTAVFLLVALGVSSQPAFAKSSMYRAPAKRVVAQRKVTNRAHVASIPASIESWQVENGRRVAKNGNGRVLVDWSVRGGTCNIRYSETKEAYFKYRTSAGCDEASHWVGSLQVGQKYKFQIAQDNWSNWSRSAIAKAW